MMELTIVRRLILVAAAAVVIGAGLYAWQRVDTATASIEPVTRDEEMAGVRAAATLGRCSAYERSPNPNPVLAPPTPRECERAERTLDELERGDTPIAREIRERDKARDDLRTAGGLAGGGLLLLGVGWAVSGPTARPSSDGSPETAGSGRRDRRDRLARQGGTEATWQDPYARPGWYSWFPWALGPVGVFGVAVNQGADAHPLDFVLGYVIWLAIGGVIVWAVARVQRRRRSS